MRSKPSSEVAGREGLEAELSRRFRVADTPIDAAGTTLRILHPANADDLITEEDYVRDERLPYWADLWPSALVLSSRVAGEAGGGRTLLELGCGAGLVTTAAVLVGYDVLATDYYEDALLFARANVLRNGGGTVRTRMVDWREFPPDLGTFDRVIASDILYEMTYAPLVARAIALCLGRDGVAVVADPGRVAVPAFERECESVGLAIECAARVPFVAGEIRQTIDIWEIRLAQ